MPVSAFFATIVSTALPPTFSAFAQQAAIISINAIWQGAIIACGLAVCLRFAPPPSAEYRFARRPRRKMGGTLTLSVSHRRRVRRTETRAVVDVRPSG